MRVIESVEASSTYGGRFSGTVRLEMLEAAVTPERPDVARVHFEAGAATNWHRHPGGQLLLLLDGRGRVGTDDESRLDLAPGTVVSAPPDERHWHGAMPGADCTWLALTYGTTAWEDSNPDRAEAG